MELKNKTLLVISPHPDDETLGCGGLISKVKAEGGKVFVIVVALGDIAQYGGESKSNARVEELNNVMKFLKVDDYDLVWVDDTKHLVLDTIPQKDLINLFESKSKCSLLKTKPDIVAIPSELSVNQDHKACYSAALTAVRPRSSGVGSPNVLIYEQTDILWSEKVFEPNLWVDISKHLDNKLDALKLYGSQMREEPELRSIQNIKRLAELRGSQVGVMAAESFKILRMVNR